MNKCKRCEEQGEKARQATVVVTHTGCCGETKHYCVECVQWLTTHGHHLSWCEACADASMERESGWRPSLRGEP